MLGVVNGSVENAESPRYLASYSVDTRRNYQRSEAAVGRVLAGMVGRLAKIDE